MQVSCPFRSDPVPPYQPDTDSQAENASSILVTRSLETHRSEALFGGLKPAGFVASEASVPHACHTGSDVP
jgi:hypothetical protein